MKDTTINLLSLVIAAIALVFSIISFIISYHQANRQIFIESTNNQPIFDVFYQLDDEYMDITILNSGSKVTMEQVDLSCTLFVDISSINNKIHQSYYIDAIIDKLYFETVNENEWRIHINSIHLKEFWNTLLHTYNFRTVFLIPKLNVIYIDINNQEDSQLFSYYDGCTLNNSYILYKSSHLVFNNFMRSQDIYSNRLKSFIVEKPYSNSFPNLVLELYYNISSYLQRNMEEYKKSF